MEHKTDGTKCWCNPEIIKVAPKKIGNKLLFIGSDGWPVEGIKGRPIRTFIRRLILTRRIMRYQAWIEEGGCEINFD